MNAKLKTKTLKKKKMEIKVKVKIPKKLKENVYKLLIVQRKKWIVKKKV